MTFYPSKFWHLIKNATSEEEVWNILERKNLPPKEENQIIHMYRTSQKVKAGII